MECEWGCECKGGCVLEASFSDGSLGRAASPTLSGSFWLCSSGSGSAGSVLAPLVPLGSAASFCLLPPVHFRFDSAGSVQVSHMGLALLVLFWLRWFRFGFAGSVVVLLVPYRLHWFHSGSDSSCLFGSAGSFVFCFNGSVRVPCFRSGSAGTIFAPLAPFWLRWFRSGSARSVLCGSAGSCLFGSTGLFVFGSAGSVQITHLFPAPLVPFGSAGFVVSLMVPFWLRWFIFM